jgi:hypothetical protein
MNKKNTFANTAVTIYNYKEEKKSIERLWQKVKSAHSSHCKNDSAETLQTLGNFLECLATSHNLTRIF